MGIGSAFGFLSCIKAATLWFPAARLNLLIGLTIMLGTTGGTSGGAPFAALVSATGWRSALFVLAALGGLLAIVAWIIVRTPAETFKKKVSSSLPDVSILSIKESVAMIFKNRQTWIFGAYGSLMYMPLSAFADLWGPSYVVHAYDQERATAAGAVSLIYIGMAAGSPLSAWVVSIFKSHRKPLMLSALLTSVVLTLTIYFPHYIPFTMTYPLFFLIGMCLSAQFLAFASICSINPRELSSTASGVHNMLCMLSGVIFQPVVGYLLDYSWDGAMQEGLAHYSMKDYFFALSVLPLSTVLALVCTKFMKETYTGEEN
jgi:MFS family permease